MSSDAFNVRKRTGSISSIKDKIGDEASSNFGTKKVISMTFNMDEDWHRRFKVEATMRGISMKDLLVECFRAYEERERSPK